MKRLGGGGGSGGVEAGVGIIEMGVVGAVFVCVGGLAFDLF